MHRKEVYFKAKLTGRTVIASDIHWRPGRKEVRLLVKLANMLNAENLVILGDLFDNLRKPLNVDELNRALEIVFGELCGIKEMHYVLSSSSHDPIIKRAFKTRIRNTLIYVYPRPVVASIEGIKAFLTHGEIIVKNGAHAFLLNYVMKTLGRNLYLEKKLKEILRLPSDWWLFMGHTHIPGLDPESRVGNAGSWRQEWVLGLPYWRPPSNTAIIVRRESVALYRLGKDLKT